MQASEVIVGSSYTCQVGRNEVVVRIVAAEDSGWRAETQAGRPMVIRDAARLRPRVGVPSATPASVSAPAVVAAPAAPVARPSAEPAAPAATKRLSLLDAAAKILKAHREPMTSGDMVRTAVERNLWAPRKGGKTPDRTLYAAILREIATKGDASRFQKTERGKFALRA